MAWTTGPGGAGVSIFYTLDPADATAALGTFFNACKASFNTSISWSIPSSGDTIDSGSGRLVGSWSGGTAASIAGTSAGTYAAGTGILIRWLTNTVVGGRKFIGHTYMVPTITSTYDSTGRIASTALTTFQAATDALVAGSALVVYKRPPKGTFAGGFFAEQTAGTVLSAVTSLKSRRT